MNRLELLYAWADTRLAMRMHAGRLAIRRKRLWKRLRRSLEATPSHAARAGGPLGDFPIIDAADMRDDVTYWNSLGITHDAAMRAALDAETGGSGIVRGDVVAGLSTGTSGRRGLFLASASERTMQIGQSIARLLPAATLVTGARIALILRADSELYRDVGTGRFAFLHIPLGLPVADVMSRLNAFGPTVLIAPPRELAALARNGAGLPATVRHVFWGSEPIAPLERAALTRDLGRRPNPIYQATEGFIASSCRHGRLHLNDDSLDIELEAVPGTNAFRPVVTDLMRTTQPMVRVRLDDLLRPSNEACACGSGRRVVQPVLGRVQDLWRIGDRVATPEAVDDHFTAHMRDHAEWRVVGSSDRIEAVIVDERDRGPMMEAAATIHPTAEVTVRIAETSTEPKRRRVTWRTDA